MDANRRSLSHLIKQKSKLHMFIIKISFVKTLKKYICTHTCTYIIFDRCNYIFLPKKKQTSIGKLNGYLWRDYWGQKWWPGKGRVSFCSPNFLYSLCILYFYVFLFLKMTFFQKSKTWELCSFPWFKIKNHTSVSKMCLWRPGQLQLPARREFCQA